MNPVIRWAGSKKKLIPELTTHIPESFERYIEPFCGSACLYFSLDGVRSARLNDLNYELINAYKEIAKNPKSIYTECTSIPATAYQYYKIRDILPSRLSSHDKAVRFLYLNRYCFNGLYRTNQTGGFNVPYGSRTGAWPAYEVFREVAERLSTIELSCGDFEHCIDDTKEGDLVYLDPPYSTRGSRSKGEYGVGAFNNEDTDRLIEVLKRLNSNGAKFIFSYRDDDQVREGIGGFCTHRLVKVGRNIAGNALKRKEVKEIIAWN